MNSTWTPHQAHKFLVKQIPALQAQSLIEHYEPRLIEPLVQRLDARYTTIVEPISTNANLGQSLRKSTAGESLQEALKVETTLNFGGCYEISWEFWSLGLTGIAKPKPVLLFA